MAEKTIRGLKAELEEADAQLADKDAILLSLAARVAGVKFVMEDGK